MKGTVSYRAAKHAIGGDRFQTHEAALLDASAVLDEALEHAMRNKRGQGAIEPAAASFLASADRDTLSDAGLPVRIAKALEQSSPFRLLRRCFELSDLDIAVLFLALSPDIDSRYAQAFGFLNDDVTRQRPSLDMAVSMFTGGGDARQNARRRLLCDGPLALHGLISLESEAARPEACRVLVLDSQIRLLLQQRDELDEEMADYAVLLHVAPAPFAAAQLADEAQTRLRRLCDAARERAYPVRIWLSGPRGAGKYRTAMAVAAALGLRVLRVDLSGIATTNQMRAVVRRVALASLCLAALPVFVGIDGNVPLVEPQGHRATAALFNDEALWFIALSAMAPPSEIRADGLMWIQLPPPNARHRLAMWRQILAQHGLMLSPPALARLAARYVLTEAEIEHVAGMVAAEAAVVGADAIGEEALGRAARSVGNEALVRVAQRVEPRTGLSGLVCSADTQAQLIEICARVATFDVVNADWGFDRLTCGAGVSALFVGPSGAGKTFAAEVLAHELGRDLYRIDLASVVSKYIGETEKNLDRVFAAAGRTNAVLLFDEADALFGKRSEVKDAHDRYANLEVAYLLQKMESFHGVAILATNLKQNLDEAFVRRLDFIVHFGFPEQAERERLWSVLWPPAAPLDADVDFARLALEFRLTGGGIRNAAVAAAHIAAAEGGAVKHAHLEYAARRELQKFGKPFLPGHAVREAA